MNPVSETLKSIKTGFKEGWDFCQLVDQVSSKYQAGTPEFVAETKRLAITKTKWQSLILGTDLSPRGLAYSTAGLLYFLAHGEEVLHAKPKSK